MSNPIQSTSRLVQTPGDVDCYRSDNGAQIFRIPVRAFPRLWAFVYVVLVGDYRVLIDCGSGYGESNQHLAAGLSTASDLAGIDLSLSNLTHILITHGHIDHIGGLSYVRAHSDAKLGIHELDRGIVTDPGERLSIVARRLDEFLAEAGVPGDKRAPLLEMYTGMKSIYQPTPVDFTYQAQQMRLGPFEILHVPGHCPGQVVIRLDDVLFSGDHVLEKTSPHQSPERLMPSTGLGHYLQSLEALRPWAQEIRLTLGGHEGPMTDLGSRLDAIRTLHMQRLQKIKELLAEPLTVAEVTWRLFGEVKGYNILLALEEAGAHVEYLYRRGELRIDNLTELEPGVGLQPVRYRCIDRASQ